MTNKLEQLTNMASQIANAAFKAGIDPKRIAVQLPNDYWMGAISDKEFMHRAVYHPESRLDKFELLYVTFYNDRSKPDWMKP